MKIAVVFLLLAFSCWSEPLRWEDLHPKPGPETRRLAALRQALPAHLQGAGWQHTPLHVGGNFIGELWLRGEGTVLNGAFMESPGSAWYQLETLHYQLPDTFGVVFSAGHNPEREGIGVRFSYCAGGETITGQSCDLAFTVWKDAHQGPEVPILGYPVTLSEEVAPPPQWLPQLPLGRIDGITSPKELERTALEGYAQILPALDQALAAGKFHKKVYGRYEGGGIPPRVTLQPLSDAEKARLRSTVKAQVDLWTGLLQSHSGEFFQAYRRCVPWPALR